MCLFIVFIKENWTMINRRRDCEDDVTAVSEPKGILRNGRQIVATWGAAKAVENLSSALHSLEAALEKVSKTNPDSGGRRHVRWTC